MPNLEYKVGGVDERFNSDSFGKFVVVLESENVLAVYAAKHTIACESHMDVVREFHLDEEKVYGGGSYDAMKGNLKIYERSEGFGSVPQEAAQHIADALANLFRERGEEIASTEVDMAKFSTSKRDVLKRNIERWKALGFDVSRIEE